MLFRIPILVTQVKATHVARPLFHAGPERSDGTLNLLYSKLTREVTQRFEPWPAATGTTTSPRWRSPPRSTLHRHDVTLNSGTARSRCGCCSSRSSTWAASSRSAPAVPDVWFEIARGETTGGPRRGGAAGALAARQEREAEEERRRAAGTGAPARARRGCRCWTVRPPNLRMPPKVPVNPFLILGGGATPDGATNFAASAAASTGCIRTNSTGPSSATRGERTGAAAAAPDSRPVLLVGPRQCGKTAMLHECVYPPHRRSGSPARREAAGSLAGLAAAADLRHVLRRPVGRPAARDPEARQEEATHVLYFDDLVGLFLAGDLARSHAERGDGAEAVPGRPHGAAWWRRSRRSNCGCCTSGTAASPTCSTCCRSASRRTTETARILIGVAAAAGGQARRALRPRRAAGGHRPAAPVRTRQPRSPARRRGADAAGGAGGRSRTRGGDSRTPTRTPAARTITPRARC